jgi:hypothetical protein
VPVRAAVPLIIIVVVVVVIILNSTWIATIAMLVPVTVQNLRSIAVLLHYRA